MSEVAKDLDCGRHVVMDAVLAYGQVPIDDPDRFGDVAALGLDETLRCRLGRWRHQAWTSQIDARSGAPSSTAGRADGGDVGAVRLG